MSTTLKRRSYVRTEKDLVWSVIHQGHVCIHCGQPAMLFSDGVASCINDPDCLNALQEDGSEAEGGSVGGGEQPKAATSVLEAAGETGPVITESRPFALDPEQAKRYGGQCEECRVYGSGHAPECSKDQAHRERYAGVLMREGWTEDQALKLAGLRSREADFANHISLRHPLLDAARELSPECSDEEAA